MANRTRTHEIKIRMSDKEYANYLKKKNKTILTHQAFIMNAINDVKMVEQPSVEYFEVLKELRAIQMDLTSLWLHADASGDYTAGKQYYDDKRRLEKLIGDLRGAFLHGEVPQDYKKQI